MKLLEHVRAKMRLLHDSWDTEECYVRWIERYILFHKQGTVWRHPNTMGVREIEQFLTHLLEGGADIRTVQELLGHSDVSTR